MIIMIIMYLMQHLIDDDDDDEYLQHPAALDSSSLFGQSSCVSHSHDPGIHRKLEHLYSSGGQTRSLSANKASLINTFLLKKINVDSSY